LRQRFFFFFVGGFNEQLKLERGIEDGALQGGNVMGARENKQSGD